MNELEKEIMNWIEDRKEGLKKASESFIREDENMEGFTWSGDLNYMKIMINDIEELYSMLTRLNRSEEIVRFELEEAEDFVVDEINNLNYEARSMYQEFISERSIE